MQRADAEKEGLRDEGGQGNDENEDNLNQQVVPLDVDIVESVDDVVVPSYMSMEKLTQIAEAFAQEEKRRARIRRPIRLGNGLEDQDMVELFVFLRAHPTRW